MLYESNLSPSRKLGDPDYSNNCKAGMGITPMHHQNYPVAQSVVAPGSIVTQASITPSRYNTCLSSPNSTTRSFREGWTLNEPLGLIFPPQNASEPLALNCSASSNSKELGHRSSGHLGTLCALETQSLCTGIHTAPLVLTVNPRRLPGKSTLLMTDDRNGGSVSILQTDSKNTPNTVDSISGNIHPSTAVPHKKTLATTLKDISNATGVTVEHLKRLTPELHNHDENETLPQGTNVKIPYIRETFVMPSISQVFAPSILCSNSEKMVHNVVESKSEVSDLVRTNDDEPPMDTIAYISKESGVPINLIVEANPQLGAFDHDTLSVGTKLVIPITKESAKNKIDETKNGNITQLLPIIPLLHQKSAHLSPMLSKMTQTNKRNETIENVSLATETTVEDILALNPHLRAYPINKPLPSMTRIQLPKHNDEVGKKVTNIRTSQMISEKMIKSSGCIFPSDHAQPPKNSQRIEKNTVHITTIGPVGIKSETHHGNHGSHSIEDENNSIRPIHGDRASEIGRDENVIVYGNQQEEYSIGREKDDYFGTNSDSQRFSSERNLPRATATLPQPSINSLGNDGYVCETTSRAGTSGIPNRVSIPQSDNVMSSATRQNYRSAANHGSHSIEDENNSIRPIHGDGASEIGRVENVIVYGTQEEDCIGRENEDFNVGDSQGYSSDDYDVDESTQYPLNIERGELHTSSLRNNGSLRSDHQLQQKRVLSSLDALRPTKSVVASGNETVRDICNEHFLTEDQLRGMNPFLCRYYARTFIPSNTVIVLDNVGGHGRKVTPSNRSNSRQSDIPYVVNPTKNNSLMQVSKKDQDISDNTAVKMSTLESPHRCTALSTVMTGGRNEKYDKERCVFVVRSLSDDVCSTRLTHKQGKKNIIVDPNHHMNEFEGQYRGTNTMTDGGVPLNTIRSICEFVDLDEKILRILNPHIELVGSFDELQEGTVLEIGGTSHRERYGSTNHNIQEQILLTSSPTRMSSKVQLVQHNKHQALSCLSGPVDVNVLCSSNSRTLKKRHVVRAMGHKAAVLLGQRFFSKWRLFISMYNSKRLALDLEKENRIEELLSRMKGGLWNERDLKKRVTELRMSLDFRDPQFNTKLLSLSPIRSSGTSSPASVSAGTVTGRGYGDSPRQQPLLHFNNNAYPQRNSLTTLNLSTDSHTHVPRSTIQSVGRGIDRTPRSPVVLVTSPPSHEFIPSCSIGTSHPYLTPVRDQSMLISGNTTRQGHIYANRKHQENLSPKDSRQCASPMRRLVEAVTPSQISDRWDPISSSRGFTEDPSSYTTTASRDQSVQRRHRKYLGITLRGLIVTRVTGPAAAAGIQANDIVLRVDGALVCKHSSFRSMIHRSKGPKVSLTLQTPTGDIFTVILPLYSSSYDTTDRLGRSLSMARRSPVNSKISPYITRLSDSSH